MLLAVWIFPWRGSVKVDEPVRTKGEAEVVPLLQVLAHDMPLGVTILRDVAPRYTVDNAPPDLSWD